MSSVMIIIFIKYLFNANINVVTVFIEIFKTITNQPTKIYNKILNYKTFLKYSYIFIIIVTFIWVFIINIISKAFTSVLLDTYFKLDSKPMFETLDEVVNNEKLEYVFADFRGLPVLEKAISNIENKKTIRAIMDKHNT